MRTKKAILNTMFSLLLELVSIVSGLIVPRLILSHFGSTYNGVITSVTQFLTIVTLLRSGAGGVTRAALYRPLAENDTKKISEILKATEIFMRKIAIIFVAILLLIAVIYPIFINDFDWLFTFSLILILGLDSFINYYFGITYQILLIADQREYIYSIIKTITTFVYVLVSVALILGNFDIRTVKLGTAIVGGITPIALNVYVKKRYAIDMGVTPDNTAIKQRWSALVHQIANYVHNNTSVVVLTFLSNSIKEVSVYAVYSMVITKIKTLIQSFTNGMEAALGNMIVKNELKVLQTNFKIIEAITFFASNFCFGCTGALMIAFVSIYTQGINDVNYIRPIFSFLFVLAEYIYCIRIPFISIVQSAGHYKQTKNSAIIEAGINLGLSIVLVYNFGLVGVAIGTLCAMLYRTIYLIIYAHANILKCSKKGFLFRMFANLLSTLVIMLSSVILVNNPLTYAGWIIDAVKVGVFAVLVDGMLLVAFYRNEVKRMLYLIKNLAIHKK